MKKFVVAMAIVLVAGSAYAQSVKGKTMMGVSGDFGVSSVHGKAPTGYSADTAGSYALGAKFGYGLTDGGMLMFGVSYAYRAMPLKYSESGYSGNYTFKQSYVDFDLGYRFLFSYLYFDLGLYYGLRAGDMKYSISGDLATAYGLLGIPTSGTVKNGDGVSLSNDFGLVLGIGHLFKITDNVALDLEGKIRYGFTDIYKYSDTKLANEAYLLSLGINYTF